MLKLKYQFENYDLAKYMLRKWEYDVATMSERFKGYHIFSHEVYPFERGGKLNYLRLAPTIEKLLPNMQAELEFVEYLCEEGYPAPKIVPTKDGQTLITLNSKWGQYHATAFQAVNGIPLENLPYHSEVMNAYGKALGYLHLLSSRYKPKFATKWNCFDCLHWIRDNLLEQPIPRGVFYEIDAVERKLQRLRRDKRNFGLTHGDFRPDNVFYDETTKRCSVIDFEDGMYHFYTSDLIMVFDSLAERFDGDALVNAKSDFIAGYESIRPLPKDYEDELPLMRRFTDLYDYTQLVHGMSEDVNVKFDWLLELKEKTNAKIKDIEHRILSNVIK